MSLDTHIKFDGVEGESAHTDHKGEIELVAWSWGLSNPKSMSGGGMGQGKPVPQDINLQYLYNKASPVLAKKCAQGVHFKEATLTARKSGEGQKDFLIIKMKEVYITSVQHSASAGGEMMESATITAGHLEYEYKIQDEKGGTGKGVKFGWDIKASKVEA
jgi:type VI secretion system secreted protein Hcp